MRPLPDRFKPKRTLPLLKLKWQGDLCGSWYAKQGRVEFLVDETDDRDASIRMWEGDTEIVVSGAFRSMQAAMRAAPRMLAVLRSMPRTWRKKK